MKTVTLGALAAGAILAAAQPSLAADVAHGQTVFRAQCGVCHKAADGDGDGGVGPTLQGVVGRKVGGDPDFAYTPVLMNSKAKWTSDSLSVFLDDPQKAAPGTAMPISVKDAAERADIIAYLATVKAAP